MGNTSSMLTQYDIEEVQQHCNHTFSQQEIVSLYQRFCQLDRNGCGFVPSEEFLSVPEFAVNPLSQVYDSDGNGKVTFNDMLDVLHDLTGHFVSQQQREQVLTRVLEEAGYSKDSFLVLSDFVKILGNSDLKMEVEVPVD
uniref:EF-hand domain-containing protein n=1 Tax=Salix viminalis TaxID=40686 RepID=A0A6N2MDM6_SALVM